MRSPRAASFAVVYWTRSPMQLQRGVLTIQMIGVLEAQAADETPFGREHRRGIRRFVSECPGPAQHNRPHGVQY